MGAAVGEAQGAADVEARGSRLCTLLLCGRTQAGIGQAGTLPRACEPARLCEPQKGCRPERRHDARRNLEPHGLGCLQRRGESDGHEDRGDADGSRDLR